MKKLFGIVGIAFAGLFALTSCKNSQDLETVRSNEISSELKTTYKLDFDSTNGKRLYNQDRGDNKSYYDIYLANDYKASLLTYTISLDTLKETATDLTKRLEERKLTSIPVHTLMFSSELYSDESSEFIKEIYNSTYGITSVTKADGNETKNYDFGISVDTEASWNRSLTGKYLNEVYLDGKTNIDIVITYLPVFLSRYYNGVEIVKFYAFLPINESAVVDGKKIVEPTDNTVKYSLADYTKVGTDVKFKFNTDEKTKNLLATK